MPAVNWSEPTTNRGGGQSGEVIRQALKEAFSMKVRASVKTICEKCKIIKRKGTVMVLCENPKHKQKQG